MIKPSSSLCNMRCNYCFYANVSSLRENQSLGLMSTDVATALIKNIAASLTEGDSVTFSFQGGEPTLAGLDFFTFFVGQVKAIMAPLVTVNYALQTNGMLVSEDWCQFFKDNNFLVGLSLDGDASLHNLNRVGSNMKGTFNHVMKAKRLFDKHGITYNILCVLTAETARRPRRIWEFIVKEKIEYIQFVPCLEPLEVTTKSPFALTGERFYQFYATIFYLWKQGLSNSNNPKVQLFEDLAALHLNGQPVTCGLSGGCSPQMIVEADGSVYPCDFYALDKYLVGNLATSTLMEVFDQLLNSNFYTRGRGSPIPEYCTSCAYYPWCQGGCKRMAKTVYGKNCGMGLFLDEFLESLLTIYTQP